MYFFPHVPKTGGTSIRYALEDYFGSEHVVYDYGISSPFTHKHISLFVYEKHDLWLLRQKLFGTPRKILVGHVNPFKYIGFVGTMNTFTFVRDPIKRLVSNFYHSVNLHGFKGDFSNYISRKPNINFLRKFFGSVPFEAIAFVGITDCYSKSIRLLNSQFGLNLVERHDNSTLQLCPKEDLPHIEGDVLEKAKQLNKEDISIYKRCCEILDTRRLCLDRRLIFVQGKFSINNNGKLVGWAWWSNGDDSPVEVDVFVKQEHRSRIVASDFIPRLLFLLPPRGAYVGFSCDCQLKKGDSVECRVAQTGQVLGHCKV